MDVDVPLFYIKVKSKVFCEYYLMLCTEEEWAHKWFDGPEKGRFKNEVDELW